MARVDTLIYGAEGEARSRLDNLERQARFAARNRRRLRPTIGCPRPCDGLHCRPTDLQAVGIEESNAAGTNPVVGCEI
jgi:hypothetical protein